MIVPEGLTVNIGRREYREGAELPANAPEAVKKQVSERIAALARKNPPERPPADNSGTKPSEGGKQ